MSQPLIKRILKVEDVEGNTYEFHNLIISESLWRDKIFLYETAFNLIAERYHKTNDLTNVEVLIIQ